MRHSVVTAVHQGHQTLKKISILHILAITVIIIFVSISTLKNTI